MQKLLKFIFSKILQVLLVQHTQKFRNRFQAFCRICFKHFTFLGFKELKKKAKEASKKYKEGLGRNFFTVS